jgi:hypothetical protein
MAQLSVLKHINDVLRANYDAIAKQSAPERWVDLITRLDEEERAQRERHRGRGDMLQKRRPNAEQSRRVHDRRIPDQRAHGGEGFGWQTHWNAVEDKRVRLASGGMYHDIDIAMVDRIKDGVLWLTETAEKTTYAWH